MPWKPSYTKEEAAEALSVAESWADALRRLGVSPYGKNFSTIRKWAARWEIDTTHLPPHRPRRDGPRFTELQAREAIARSRSWTEALRRLGYCPTGGNPQTLKAWAHRWKISADHFDPWAANRGGPPTSESAYAAGRDPRGGIDLLSQQSQAPPLSGGAEAADLRNLWPGGDLAWSPNGLDSRPRERNEKRQPDREHQDHLPELRGDA